MIYISSDFIALQTTKFKVHTVSYRPTGKTEHGSVTYSTHQENKYVSKIFIISLRLIGCMGNETS